MNECPDETTLLKMAVARTRAFEFVEYSLEQGADPSEDLASIKERTIQLALHLFI
jgi:hypothetical protein